MIKLYVKAGDGRNIPIGNKPRKYFKYRMIRASTNLPVPDGLPGYGDGRIGAEV
jgi:hypothetical protein